MLAWIRRRRWTIGLAIFFGAWYALQLGVLQLFGDDIARWWFYFEQPPNTISPGIVLAPISHDLNTLTHIGGNLFFLLIAGGLAEPYIGKDRILIHVIGIDSLGIFIANLTIVIHSMWIVAGASVGILSLWTYSGLQMRYQAAEIMSAGLPISSQGVERGGSALLLGSIPLFLVNETILSNQIHSGHTIGILLGFLYYGLESYLVPIETSNRTRYRN